MIAIVDYEIGNVLSVARAVEVCGFTPIITKNHQELKEATHIILPGVGSFYEGMNKLKENNLIDILNYLVIEKQTPFLGICLGMQLLADIGYEQQECKGLGWIQGEISLIPASKYLLPLPHVGWNNVAFKKSLELFQGIKENSDFYFVHSFYFNTKNENNILATVHYGEEIPVIVNNKNIYGMQFHPEKSQKVGLKLLNNFLQI
nr:imidazole glycerol phosphate synthase subunit HisH [Pigmentibacter ruber]